MEGGRREREGGKEAEGRGKEGGRQTGEREGGKRKGDHNVTLTQHLASFLQAHPGLSQGRSTVSVATSGSHQLKRAVSTTPGEGSSHSSSVHNTSLTHQERVNWYSCPFRDCRGLEQITVQLWGAKLLASPTSLCCLSLGQGPRCDGRGRQAKLPQGVKVRGEVAMLHVGTVRARSTCVRH